MSYYPSFSKEEMPPGTAPHLQIQFCIRRPDGHFVPLIAADTLPPLAECSRILRSLTSEQALQYGLTLVGPQSSYSASATSVGTERRDGPATRASRPTSYDSRPLTTTSEPLQTSSRADGQPSHVRPYTPDDIERIRDVLRRGNKVWCSKWLDTRDCAFQQQGCRYKHDIPPRALWIELGFPHGRPWWNQMGAEDHVKRTLSRMQANPMDSETGEPNGLCTNKGRPRVPVNGKRHAAVGAGLSATSLDTVISVKPASEQSRQISAANPESPAEELLIDLDEQPMPSVRSTSPPDSHAPVPKKVRTMSRHNSLGAGVEAWSASPMHTSVPAGQPVASCTATTRSQVRRRRARGQRSTKRKN